MCETSEQMCILRVGDIMDYGRMHISPFISCHKFDAFISDISYLLKSKATKCPSNIFHVILLSYCVSTKQI